MKKPDIILVKHLINDLITCETSHDLSAFNITANSYSYIITTMYKSGVLVMFMIHILHCN